MSPPVSDSAVEMSVADVQQFKSYGWIAVGTILLGWAGWISLKAIATSSHAAVIEERQNSQFEMLRDDIAEIKQLLQKD